MFKCTLQIGLVIYALILTVPIYCENEVPLPMPATDPPVDYDETTVVPTDIPQAYIDQAIIVDYGRYTTIVFQYENDQWQNLTKIDQCYDHYLKCLLSLNMPATVCMFYNNYEDSGVKYHLTYCDGYFENCRLGYRYWRIIDYGKCELHDKWEQLITDVRRSYNGRKLF